MSFGVFRGSGQTGEIPKFATWADRPVTHVLDFTGGTSSTDPAPWAKIENPAWWLNRHAGKPWQLVLSVAMLPNRNFTLADGARGRYYQHWRKFFAVVAVLYPNLIVRLGWEFNGRFYPWAAGGRELQFAAYWRRIVLIAREVAPGVRFDWCPLRGNLNADVEACWPGDDAVDVMGLDAYDTAPPNTGDRWRFQRDGRYGLAWHRQFARAHGKPVSFPEWGITVRPNDRLGGGDNPAYISNMLAWIADSKYACYFEVDAKDARHRLMLGQFPKAAAAFLA